MAKRLTNKQKEEIVKFFMIGKSIGELSQEFNCTKLTISRNLIKNLGERKYKELNQKIKEVNNNFLNSVKKNTIEKKNNDNLEKQIENYDNKFTLSKFVEIAPLNYQFDNESQKELSSVPISDVKFPKIVYLIVDKKVELEIKSLRDYPRWEFLSEDELDRKTIEIYFELKIAKGFCGKEQKVIKVPNTDVFKIAAPLLHSRGITRIVSSDQLISL